MPRKDPLDDVEDPILYSDEREQSVYDMGRLHSARDIRHTIDKMIVARCESISLPVESADTSFDSALKTLFALEAEVAEIMRDCISR